MKLNLLKMKTSSFLKKNKAIRVSLPYKQALSIGVIFSVEDKSKHDEIKDFVKRLEQDGKQVVVMSFLPQNKDNYEFMYDFFTEKDLTFWGTLTSTAALKFADMPFDLLYYIDTSPNPYILNLLARSKAKCRVGKFWESGTPYFEMMIENKNGNHSLIDTMYKYTRGLK
jgi:hypothetical protein